MKATEIRALADDFRAKVKPKVKTVYESIFAMQAMMLAEVAAQLADLTEKIKVANVEAPKEKK